MSLQDDLLENLVNLRQGAVEVDLVASFQHEGIGFPEELHVFLPDIHLITKERQDSIGFYTNYPELLRDLVLSLKDFKTGAAGPQTTVHQVGDLLDLWRQTPQLDPRQDVAAGIANDRQDIMGALLDYGLQTQFLLGNHDFNLCNFPNFTAWRRSRYLLDSTGAPSAIALHGDVFDWEQDALNTLPGGAKDLLVYLFAPVWPLETRKLGELIRLNNQLRSAMEPKQYIRTPEPAALGRTVPASANIPARFNVQTEQDHLTDGMEYAAAARDLCQRSNRENGTRLKMAVIGHTHHARIAVMDNGPEDFFMLVDCGAWVETYSTPESAQALPNAQIAAIGGNQARIYQVQPR
jgi:UDP-2,3-diacylglucosamine pyrophosphatase LpxH